MKTLILALAIALAAAPLAAVQAQTDTAAQQASPPWVQAEVKKVDVSAGRLTLKHGDIPNLDMPGMTMAFRVAEPKMLDGVKPGDAVRVAIDKVKGQLTVVRIEPVR